MTPDELKAQEAEILAARARDFTQQIQATPVSDEQKKKGGEVAEEVADLALDLADTDFVDLALKGVSKAVSGIGELASGALDMAGTATSVVGDVASGAASVAGDVVSGAASAAGDVVGGVLEGVGDILGGLLS